MSSTIAHALTGAGPDAFLVIAWCVVASLWFICAVMWHRTAAYAIHEKQFWVGAMVILTGLAAGCVIARLFVLP